MIFKDPRKVLAEHGLRPKKAMSQNFLCSPRAVQIIADAAVSQALGAVVELGPGCGTLTAALLDRGVRVLAFEQDREMLKVLEHEFGKNALEVRHGDASALDYRSLAHELGHRVPVVGNLPYAVTGAILRRLIDSHSQLEHAVIMIQREVADRLLSPPGDSAYGALTVFAHNVFHSERIAKVPRTAFHPPPKVDSAVVKLTPRPQPLTPTGPSLSAVIHAAFRTRRKTLRNALRLLPSLDGRDSEALLRTAGIDPGLRGERLSVQEFGALAHALAEMERTTRSDANAKAD